jgi:small subunit ribosomal protein S18
LPRPQRGRGRPRRYGRRPGRFRRRRRKVCEFCSTKKRKALPIDYKLTDTLRRFLDERSRIQKARKTGTCRKHQRKLGRAIKRSREVALLPYSED